MEPVKFRIIGILTDLYMPNNFWGTELYRLGAKSWTQYFTLGYGSLYSLIRDFLVSQINIWTTKHGLMFGSSYLNHLHMIYELCSWYEHPLQSILHHTTFSNICVMYPCSYICDCLKMPKKSQINECSDKGWKVWRYENQRGTLRQLLYWLELRDVYINSFVVDKEGFSKYKLFLSCKDRFIQVVFARLSWKFWCHLWRQII